MANFRINVKIEGGKSFMGFYCLLYRNGLLMEEFISEYGFEKNYEGLNGSYMLCVFGTNPIAPNRKTTIRVYFNNDQIEVSNISTATPSIQQGNRVNATYYFRTR
ncbi:MULTISPECIES: hypothetical protein [Chryseobacterium]|uniref:hypothetical protein n=1 Tax=Chryseobacterium TaxID=59732 RepID=UPI00158DCE31|nr:MULTISPECIES: hypothetical protein [Chryseobacterium]